MCIGWAHPRSQVSSVGGCPQRGRRCVSKNSRPSRNCAERTQLQSLSVKLPLSFCAKSRVSPSDVSEARINKRMRMKARCSGALSIHRLEGSRPRLRLTRALCKFYGGKVGRGRAPKGVRRSAEDSTAWAGAGRKQDDRKKREWRSGKKRFVPRQGGERLIVQKHAEFPSCG
jgi:hypothetical protein